MIRKRIITTGAVGLVLIVVGVFIAVSCASGDSAVSTAKVFAIDDYVGYISEKNVTKRPIKGKALVVQFDEQREIVIDLQPRRKGMINIMTSSGGENTSVPMQQLIIEPAAGNVVALGTKLLQSDGTPISATQPADNDDPPAIKAFVVDAYALDYFNGKHSKKEPLQAEVVLIELGETQRFFIDLRKPREGNELPRDRVLVTAGGYGATEATSSQLLQIEPSAANGIYVRASGKLE